MLRQAQTRQSSPDRHALSPVPPPQGTHRPPRGRPGAGTILHKGVCGVYRETMRCLLPPPWVSSGASQGTSALLGCHRHPPGQRHSAVLVWLQRTARNTFLSWHLESSAGEVTAGLCISPAPSKVARPPSAPGSLINNENTSWNSPAARDRGSIVSSSHYLFDHSNAINSVTPARRTVIRNVFPNSSVTIEHRFMALPGDICAERGAAAS